MQGKNFECLGYFFKTFLRYSLWWHAIAPIVILFSEWNKLTELLRPSKIIPYNLFFQQTNKSNNVALRRKTN